MKFQIHCETQDGRKDVYGYDNITGEVTAPNGSVVVKSRPTQSTFSSNKQTSFKSMRIQLGLKCNMNCKYCSQDKTTGKQFGPKHVKDFVDKLHAVQAVEHFELWGGEPMVYWKTVTLLVPLLHKRFPDATFSMVTNGTLVTDDKIDFCKAYDIQLVFSHDGPGYYLRGEDPLNNPDLLRLWRRAFAELRCSINCVLTPANIDIEATRRYFDGLLGRVHLNFEGIMTYTGLHVDELMFTRDLLKKLQKNIFDAICFTDDPNKFPSLTSGVLRMLEPFEAHPCSTKCSLSKPNQIAVNLNGDVLSCHNFDAGTHAVGNIEDLHSVDISKLFTPWSERPECKKCVVLNVCRGSCPQLEGTARTLTCKNEYAYASAIFQAFWMLKFGVVITMIVREH